jgi:DHA1 family multidrug resistance protein-like MFS transporter
MQISRRPTLAPVRTPRAGVVLLLGNNCLMNFGFAMLVPLIAIHFTGRFGFAAAAVGLVLALRQFSQQGLDVVGGIFADRFGARAAIVIGCCIRAFGFVGVGGSTTLGSLMLFAVISGIGGSFFDASGTAALAELVQPERRQAVYAASATMGNVGQTVGPVVGIALLGINFEVVSLAAAGVFVLVGALTFALLPAGLLRAKAGAGAGRPAKGAGAEAQKATGVRATLAALGRDRTFLLLTLLLAGFWFLWAQMNITVPLEAVRLGGPERGPRLAALAFAINAGPAILIQYPLARFVGGHFDLGSVLAVCTLVSGLGMALAFATPLVPLFMLGIALFALARMLVWPTMNVLTASLAPQGMLGAYFGFGALALAIGGGVGQYVGGFLYDTAGRTQQPALLWGPLLLVGIGAAAGLRRLPLRGRAEKARALAGVGQQDRTASGR